MISELFQSFLADILSLVASVLQTGQGLPADFSGSLAQVMVFGYQMSFVIPWSTIFSLFSFIIAFEFTLLIIKLIIFISKLIRG